MGENVKIFVKNSIKETNFCMIPVLTNEEERELFLQYHSNDKRIKELAREKIIIHNLRLVLKISLNFENPGLSIEDRYMEGCIGLLIAIDKYDLSKDARFSTYASYWIRQSIIRAGYIQADSIRVPVYYRKKCNIYFGFIRNFYSKNLRFPTEEEILNNCDLTIEDINTLSKLSTNELSIDNVSVDCNSSLISDTFNVLEEIDKRFLGDLIEKLFEIMNLSERDKTIIMLRFGLNNNKIHTYSEIAKIFNVSHQAINQTINSIFKKIRENSEVRLLLDGYIPEYVDDKVKKKVKKKVNEN